MYKALYRKYRPLVFSDVVGQEHVTKPLRHQVINGSVSHAYLFTGSRGTGKTTCAKILAKAINCTSPKDGNPCGKCPNCIAIGNESLPDVLEIDAASNNGVDDIRELRERIAFAPAQAKYKVYIIDEVHMLSSAASNALLKTLEEPPSHAVFILATTEVNALLPTILSRCQRYDFHRIEPEQIADRIKYVSEKEGLTITSDAAFLIASLSDGGMRDALSLLDLCAAADGDINEELVNSICGRASTDYLFTLAECISASDTARALKSVASLHSQSVDMKRLCSEMCEFYRTVMLICSGIDAKTASGSTEALAKKYADFSEKTTAENAVHCLSVLNGALSDMGAGNRRAALESALIKLTNPRLDSSNEALLSRIAALETTVKRGVKIAAANDSEEADAALQAEETPKPEKISPPPEVVTQKLPEGELQPITEWNDIINACFKTAPLMFGFLKGSTASRSGNTVVIHSQSANLRSQMARRGEINYKGLCAAISEVLGEELVPMMEPEKKSNDSDPLMQFAERLENL